MVYYTNIIHTYYHLSSFVVIKYKTFVIVKFNLNHPLQIM